MLVKACDTGEKIDKIIAWQAPNKKYYTSKSAYETMRKQTDARNNCIDLMYKLLDYQSFMKIPTFFYKKLKEWEGYGYDVILKAMELKSEAVEYSLRTKQFNSEGTKIMYVSAIIENSLTDAMKLVAKEKKLIAQAEQRSSLDENINTDSEINVNRKQESKNISKWLVDEND